MSVLPEEDDIEKAKALSLITGTNQVFDVIYTSSRLRSCDSFVTNLDDIPDAKWFKHV